MGDWALVVKTSDEDAKNRRNRGNNAAIMVGNMRRGRASRI